jgi:hypothetical protein
VKVYFVQWGDSGPIKIGTTTKDVKERVRHLQTGIPEKLILRAIMDGGRDIERALHRMFSHLKLRRRGEWFTPERELLDYIEHLTPPVPAVAKMVSPSNTRNSLKKLWHSRQFESDDEFAWIFGMDSDMLREAYGPSGRPR